MAIGDAVAVFMGTADVTRQPAAGVEEQISAVIVPNNTDSLRMDDATNLVEIATVAITGQTADTSLRNIALMITNTLFLRKVGTTDRHYVGGVQTNA